MNQGKESICCCFCFSLLPTLPQTSSLLFVHGDRVRIDSPIPGPLRFDNNGPPVLCLAACALTKKGTDRERTCLALVVSSLFHFFSSSLSFPFFLSLLVRYLLLSFRIVLPSFLSVLPPLIILLIIHSIALTLILIIPPSPLHFSCLLPSKE